MPPAETPCSLVRIRAQFNALNIYEIARQQAMADFQKAYLEKCLSVSETFKLTDTIKEYHYTLYYYDLAGNLVRTVPPNGVRPVYRRGFLDSVALARQNGTEKTPIHTFVTRYCYNSLNQVTLQRTPDAGTSQFWYDRLGRLAISQNAKQKGDIDLYSYTNYDSLGRITEVGQIRSSTQMTEALAGSAVDLGSWFSAASSKRAQITRTIYDIPFYAFEGESIGQRNLRNRVSYTQVIDTISNILARNSTYYSYDIHGNVDTLMQDFGSNQYFASAMNAANRFKRIVYDYDLISGKVNQVSYQPNRWDAYYHRYSYDGENRLVEVLSGRDSVMLRHFPEREARYNYYKHGPLGRTVIGQLQVQGLDYVYTLQGWLKGVNPVMGGTMRNGTDSVEAYPVAQDAYGFSLHYFKDDYRAIGHLPAGTSVLGALGAAARPLYNGNIATMAVNLPRFGPANVYNYSYDQLNRLTGMDAYSGLNGTAGIFVPQLQDAYRERVSYDPNGNILTYLRRGDNSRKNMDSLFYHYIAGTNKLHKVLDQAPDISGGAYTQYNDLRQNQADNNYSYDSIGNLTQDVKDTISNISWTVYGKIRKIVKNGNIIEYAYDGGGNRIMKKSTEGTYFYVRDASGNVMAVYKEQTASTVTLEETHLYGSSRLGIAMAHGQADGGINIPKDYDTAKIITFTRGEKFFELSNHLGNVLVTVSDKRLQFTQNGTDVSHYQADITSANDYYPFGMLMPGRKYSSGKYRYGFNGKENDNEFKGDGNQQDYGMRVYDGRIGKFLSVDPILKRFPFYSPYHFAGNTPIWAIDLDGKEPNFKYSENGVYGVGNFSDLMVGSIKKLSTKLVLGKGDKKFQIEWLVTENGDPLGFLASRIIPEEEYKRYYGGSGNGVQPAYVIESDKLFDFGKRIDEFYDKSSKSELYDVLWGKIDRDPVKRFFDPRAWLLSEVGSAAGQLSLSLFKTGILRYASMSNTEVRAWYNLRLSSINTKVPLTEENAKMIVSERNAVKQTARLLMKDRKAANKLDETDPIRDFEYYKNKYSSEGFQGEELWKVIIEKAKTANQVVNKKFGIQ